MHLKIFSLMGIYYLNLKVLPIRALESFRWFSFHMLWQVWTLFVLIYKSSGYFCKLFNQTMHTTNLEGILKKNTNTSFICSWLGSFGWLIRSSICGLISFICSILEIVAVVDYFLVWRSNHVYRLVVQGGGAMILQFNGFQLISPEGRGHALEIHRFKEYLMSFDRRPIIY